MEKIWIENYNEDRFETAVALGNFDGVHIGHKKLIGKMVESAKELNLRPSILLFTNHTKRTIIGDAPSLLTSNSQKEDLIGSIGVETVYKIKFDEKLMKLKAEDFVKDILIDRLRAKVVVVGFDYRFGHKAMGDSDLLKSLGDKYGFKVIVMEPVYLGDILVSSTKIRDLIKEGNLKLANSMLGRNYQVIGRVISGNKIGRKLGYPTANLELIEDFTIPKLGVYRTKTTLHGKTYLSATSVGHNPTFHNRDIRIECHIIDFDEKIYDQYLSLDFIEYLREEIKFERVEDLKAQIEEDIKSIISRH
ncbi:MAG: bifunctional riboflavin kinase/FAD synthetase [Tissierellia bacterium]|nr:bifunctional riboflavin kinase/FAD synthetase [Tissierellia bacterium]